MKNNVKVNVLNAIVVIWIMVVLTPRVITGNIHLFVLTVVVKVENGIRKFIRKQNTMNKKEYDHQRYLKQRKKLLKQHKQWRSNNPDYYKNRKVKTNELQNKRRKTLQGFLRGTYANIKKRCNNENCKDYKYYGGRGIKCRFNSFDDFADYVINVLQVEPRGLTIDRIDNDGHYEKGNIRFVTQAENNNNRRKNYVKQLPCR